MTSFDYITEKQEEVLCALCGTDDFYVLSEVSKNKLPVRTCLCKRCGLIYLNPRMTTEGYDNYYKYFYRQDRSMIKGRDEAEEEKSFQSARKFGRALAQRLKSFIQPGLTVDVGSSTGGVLFGIREILPSADAFGIEPSVSEAEFANKKGVKTEQTLFENFRGDDLAASTVLCVKSLNHLLKPRAFFEWARRTLKKDGYLILAVKNFRQQVYRAGALEHAIQIDHPYMFVPETLRRFVESAGFDVVYEDVDEKKSKAELVRKKEEGLPRQHILLVARPSMNKKISRDFDGNIALSIRRQLHPLSVKLHNIFLRIRVW